MSITIRPAVAEDTRELAQLKRHSARRAYTGLVSDTQLNGWLERSCCEAWFAWRIGRKHYHVLVAVDGHGKIVGYSGFRQRDTRADGPGVGMYAAMSNAGIGLKLETARRKLAMQLGCTRIRAACWRANEPAQRFFERRGYTKTGTGFRDSVIDMMVDHYEADLKTGMVTA